MEMNETAFENGIIFIDGVELDKIAAIAWQKHAAFEGVFTKNLLLGKGLKAMLVKIEPNCEIKNHVHEKEAELHEVILGKGDALVNQKSVPYTSGVISFIPSNTPHSVKADSGGLVLLAKFTPSLA
jgi:quercetin dioxygenase-like cupin family protein